MLRNYLTTAARALRRYLGYTAINVAGLGVGIAVSVLLLLFVRSELAVNDVFPKAERIYRVDSWQAEGDPGIRFLAPAPAGETMERVFPGVQAQTWLYGIAGTIGVENDFYRRSTLLVNPSFTDVFEFPLVQGTWNGALDEPRSILLHEEAARTLFGTTDVVGRTVDVQTWRRGTQPYTVTGVWTDLPENSVTGFGGVHYKVILAEAGTWDFAEKESWSSWKYEFLVQYVRLAESADVNALRQQLDGFVEAQVPEGVRDTLRLALNPLASLYLTDNENQGWHRIYLLAALAGLVLLIAGINFTNLATTRALGRTREVGVRKTLGAQRRQLAGQFLVEAVLVSVVATGFGAGLAAAGIDLFAQVVGVEFVLLNPWDATTIGALIGLALAVGLLAGAYPAFVLSGFSPTAVLNDRLSLGWSAGALRKGLVVIQFAAAVMLLIGVYVVHEQIAFAINRDLPYPADRILTIDSAPRDFSPEGFQRIQTARERIEALGIVESATVSWTIPGARAVHGVGGTQLRRPQWNPDRHVQAGEYQRVDPHFDETYGLTVTHGRFFRTPVTDDSTGVVLNETAMQALELEDPIGATVEVGEEARTVVGVVQDFNHQNVHQDTGPMVLTPLQPGGWYRTMSVKAASEATDIVARVRTAWEEVLPDAPFDYVFLNEKFYDAYAPERQTRRLVGAGAGLALFVALLGLVGLMGFTVRRRTKEIGIRKALGASVASIVRLLSADVAKLVGIAFVVGAPVAYLLARWWLQDFAARIDLTPWPFLGVGFVATLCALAAVSVHTFRAARVDPAETLRDE